jgi:dihydrolipoamide dehydrogenase
MGTKVTIVEFLPRVVPVEDEEISKELDKNFKKNGITIMTSSEVTSVDTSGAGVKAKVKTPDGETTLEADVLLSAVGVSANVEGIGLEELGIKTDKGKIMVDKFYQTNVPGIYAIGDCVPGQALAHVASKEGIICVEGIGFNEKKYNHKPEPIDYNNVPGCTYCYPEIASVGYTEKQAKDAGYEIKVGKFPLSASGKASAAGHPEGFIKVIFDAKYGEWLGTHMIGYNVTEIIVQTVTARKLETTYQEVLNSIHPHPTISESVKDAIEVAYGEAIHL